MCHDSLSLFGLIHLVRLSYSDDQSQIPSVIFKTLSGCVIYWMKIATRMGVVQFGLGMCVISDIVSCGKVSLSFIWVAKRCSRSMCVYVVYSTAKQLHVTITISRVHTKSQKSKTTSKRKCSEFGFVTSRRVCVCAINIYRAVIENSQPHQLFTNCSKNIFSAFYLKMLCVLLFIFLFFLLFASSLMFALVPEQNLYGIVCFFYICYFSLSRSWRYFHSFNVHLNI